MSAHFVINRGWDGRLHYQVEFAPTPERDRKKGDTQLSTVVQRCAAGKLKKTSRRLRRISAG